MRAGRKLELEIDAPCSTENEREKEETHWERVLKKLALLWSGLVVRVILDPVRGRMISFIQGCELLSYVSAQLPVPLGSQAEGATNKAATHQPVPVFAVFERQPASNVCNESIL